MDKLPKAAIKAFGVDGALEWTESEKEKLEQIDLAYTSEDAKKSLKKQKKVYLEKAILTGDSEDINEFNALMKFIYEGRRQEETKCIETSIATIMNSWDDICAYCKSWSSDTDYSVELPDF